MFEQIRYELNGVVIDFNGVVIDSCLKPGITSSIKAYLSLNDNESRSLQMSGWAPSLDNIPTFSTDKKYFSAAIPLKFLLGFAEDYNKIIINASQELILVRSKSDDNSYKSDGTKKATFEIEKIEWRVPHISVNDESRMKLLEILRNDKPIYIPFRKWELYELPALRTTKDDIWSIKSSTNLEKPRYVIVAFQNNKKDNYKADSSVFDNSLITNVRVYLNSDSFPYNNMNLEISKDRYVTAYQMYVAFQHSYYNRTPQPLMDYVQFKDNALYVIDCSKQNDAVKTSTVDLKIEMESEIPFKAGTVAYCLILHDTIVEYTPLSGTVKKII
ncbi:hypothetical protein QE152_g22238 [Popillia japonica]|uniref:Double jelly roll-like domain-containing protein n=1 Tax=Popillia japonica TaxID=7064 RepID=A0AAW1KMR3_POPJA